MRNVSIKYTRGVGRRAHPFEVGIDAHVRHGRQDVRKRTLAWSSKRCFKDGPVFSLGAMAVFPGLLLKRSDVTGNYTASCLVFAELVQV